MKFYVVRRLVAFLNCFIILIFLLFIIVHLVVRFNLKIFELLGVYITRVYSNDLTHIFTIVLIFLFDNTMLLIQFIQLLLYLRRMGFQIQLATFTFFCFESEDIIICHIIIIIRLSPFSIWILTSLTIYFIHRRCSLRKIWPLLLIIHIVIP